MILLDIYGWLIGTDFSNKTLDISVEIKSKQTL